MKENDQSQQRPEVPPTLSPSETQSQYPKKSRPKYTNPLQKAIHSFLQDYVSSTDPQSQPQASIDNDIDIDILTCSIPKRYSIYPPLLLLPPHFLSSTPEWTILRSHLTSQNLQALYRCIITAFAPQGITHLALNSPIAPTTSAGTTNSTRSPTNLVPLYGDFGPASNLLRDQAFESTLWVSTVQNGGIHQSWAPLFTMFSRGNIREKARILCQSQNHGQDQRPFDGLDGAHGRLGQELGEIAVLDMYVGIGYFAFSYLKRGVGRVFGWELNAWSVEGLRRGCRANGWGMRVLWVGDQGEVEDEAGRVGGEALEGLVKDLAVDRGIRMVAFQGDNRWAASVMARLKETADRAMGSTLGANPSCPWLAIRHVNLGLLPSSRLSWEDAMDVLDLVRGGWVHVHENVNVRELERKLEFVVQQFQAHLGESRKASCGHIEQVKTYAPGVMHCVFDVHVEPCSPSPEGIDNG